MSRRRSTAGFVLAYEGRRAVTVRLGQRRPGRRRRSLRSGERGGDRRGAWDCCPQTVPHVEAAANSGRAALLVHALARDPTCCYDATRDWLHQDYREPAMPRVVRADDSSAGEGFAAVISGAGPSVLVLGRLATWRAG